MKAWEFTATYIGMKYREKVKPTKEAKEMRRKTKEKIWQKLQEKVLRNMDNGTPVAAMYGASLNNPAKQVLSAPAKSTLLPKTERRRISLGIQYYAPDIQQLL